MDSRLERDQEIKMERHISECAFCNDVYKRMRKGIEGIIVRIPDVQISEQRALEADRYLLKTLKKLREIEVKDFSLKVKDYSRSTSDVLRGVLISIFSVRAAMLLVAFLIAAFIVTLMTNK